jgi:hypothetical protein
MAKEERLDGGVDFARSHARPHHLPGDLMGTPDHEPCTTHEGDFTGRAEIHHDDIHLDGTGIRATFPMLQYTAATGGGDDVSAPAPPARIVSRPP